MSNDISIDQCKSTVRGGFPPPHIGDLELWNHSNGVISPSIRDVRKDNIWLLHRKSRQQLRAGDDLNMFGIDAVDQVDSCLTYKPFYIALGARDPDKAMNDLLRLYKDNRSYDAVLKKVRYYQQCKAAAVRLERAPDEIKKILALSDENQRIEQLLAKYCDPDYRIGQMARKPLIAYGKAAGPVILSLVKDAEFFPNADAQYYWILAEIQYQPAVDRFCEILKKHNLFWLSHKDDAREVSRHGADILTAWMMSDSNALPTLPETQANRIGNQDLEIVEALGLMHATAALPTLKESQAIFQKLDPPPQNASPWSLLVKLNRAIDQIEQAK